MTFDFIQNEKKWDSFVILEPIARVLELEIFVLKISGEGQIASETINAGKGNKRFYMVVDTRNDKVKFDTIKNDRKHALGFCFSPSDKSIQKNVFQMVYDKSMKL